MSFFSKFKQDVVASTVNSSISNLVSGGSFTGTVESTLGIAGIQVSVYTDQNCLIYVDQSPDTTPTPDAPHWDLTNTYQYYANTSFGRTIQAISSYYRVRVVNQNSSTGTTFFRLQTALCPIVEAVPQSLDSEGNFCVGIKSVQDLYGFNVENTPIGEQRVVIPTRLIGTNFEGTTLDTNFWTATVANNGTVAQANAQVLLSTNTTANGSAKLNSVRRARYVSATGLVFRAIIQVSSGVTNNKRRWGAAYGTTMPTFTDGAYFELNGTTFSIVTMKGSSETRVSSGSFNGVLGLTYTPITNVATYEIYWTNSKVWFVIGDKVLHTVSASSATWAATMSFFIYMDNVNSNSITTNCTLECRVASIRRLGSLLTLPQSRYQSGTTAGIVLKYSPGSLHRLIVSQVSSSGSVITLYDNTAASGTIISSFTFTWPAGGNFNPQSFDFSGLPFHIGLTLVIATQNANVTIIYE